MDQENEFFKDKDPEVVMRHLATFLDVALKEMGIEDHEIVQGMKAGNTAAQTMGLSREELELLYAVGFNCLNKGDAAKAQDSFIYLSLIDPLEAKNYYCLGMAYQMQGEAQKAADAYVNFLALDATNPDGYLRYGECLLALGEKQEAIEAFELAQAEAARGNGDAKSLQEAQSKLALLKKETAQ